MDANSIIEEAIKDGIREGIKSKMNANYSNPFEKLIAESIAKHDKAIRTMLCDAINSAIGDEPFCDEIRKAVRTTLAKVLVARFGGELEKQVNALKSNPSTRARITVAIDDILKSQK